MKKMIYRSKKKKHTAPEECDICGALLDAGERCEKCEGEQTNEETNVA